MTIPYWVPDAVFYQIFPDRFADGDKSNNPPNVQRWGSTPTLDGFQGGDLRGIVQHFDYLLDLGVNALYLNPIFASPSNHRYNISDYYRIDPRLGSLEDFRALIETAHRNDCRVILDGVFNHCGRGFFAFSDVLENGERSAYRDWFHILRFPLDAYGPGEADNYLGWWKFKSLPKLNTSNPATRRYLMEVARYWIEQGADGWRLDVPNEIDDDPFWDEFRRTVRAANRDAYLVGEIWDIQPRWANDSHFDGLMNYPVREALLALLTGKEAAGRFGERLQAVLAAYGRENRLAMYNLLDSHDTERFLTLLDGSLEKLKLAWLFLFAFPGTPALYYGDEIGLQGGKDPDSRRAFPWKEAEWNRDLRSWVTTLISVRKRTPALKRGDFLPLQAGEDSYTFARLLGAGNVLVALNSSNHPQVLDIPASRLGWRDGQPLTNLVSGEKLSLRGSSLALSLPAWGGAWIG